MLGVGRGREHNLTYRRLLPRPNPRSHPHPHSNPSVVEPTVGRHEGVDEVHVEELGVAERVVVDGEIGDRGHSCEWDFVGLLRAYSPPQYMYPRRTFLLDLVRDPNRTLA